MKKYLVIMLVIVMALSLGACGGGGSDGDSDDSALKKNLPHEIVESGYTVEKNSNEWDVNYGIIIKNPNKDKKLAYPEFRITARDKDGEVLSTDDQSLGEIAPKTTVAYAGIGLSLSEKPDSVEFEIIEPDEYSYENIDPDAPKYVTLTTDGVKVKKDEYFGSLVTGEVVNDNDETYDTVDVVIIFRDKDGKIVCGDTSTADNVKAKSKTPFEIDVYSESATDKYEIYAYPWV